MVGIGTLICSTIISICAIVVLVLDSRFPGYNFEVPYRLICLFYIGLTIFLLVQYSSAFVTYLRSRSYDPNADEAKPRQKGEEDWFEVG